MTLIWLIWLIKWLFVSCRSSSWKRSIFLITIQISPKLGPKSDPEPSLDPNQVGKCSLFFFAFKGHLDDLTFSMPKLCRGLGFCSFGFFGGLGIPAAFIALAEVEGVGTCVENGRSMCFACSCGSCGLGLCDDKCQV